MSIPSGFNEVPNIEFTLAAGGEATTAGKIKDEEKGIKSAGSAKVQRLALFGQDDAGFIRIDKVSTSKLKDTFFCTVLTMKNADGNNVYVRVNKESLRKRLGMEKSAFKEALQTRTLESTIVNDERYIKSHPSQAQQPAATPSSSAHPSVQQHVTEETPATPAAVQAPPKEPRSPKIFRSEHKGLEAHQQSIVRAAEERRAAEEAEKKQQTEPSVMQHREEKYESHVETESHKKAGKEQRMVLHKDAGEVKEHPVRTEQDVLREMADAEAKTAKKTPSPSSTTPRMHQRVIEGGRRFLGSMRESVENRLGQGRDALTAATNAVTGAPRKVAERLAERLVNRDDALKAQWAAEEEKAQLDASKAAHKKQSDAWKKEEAGVFDGLKAEEIFVGKSEKPETRLTPEQRRARFEAKKAKTPAEAKQSAVNAAATAKETTARVRADVEAQEKQDAAAGNAEAEARAKEIADFKGQSKTIEGRIARMNLREEQGKKEVDDLFDHLEEGAKAAQNEAEDIPKAKRGVLGTLKDIGSSVAGAPGRLKQTIGDAVSARNVAKQKAAVDAQIAARRAERAAKETERAAKGAARAATFEKDWSQAELADQARTKTAKSKEHDIAIAKMREEFKRIRGEKAQKYAEKLQGQIDVSPERTGNSHEVRKAKDDKRADVVLKREIQKDFHTLLGQVEKAGVFKAGLSKKEQESLAKLADKDFAATGVNFLPSKSTDVAPRGYDELEGRVRDALKTIDNGFDVALAKLEKGIKEAEAKRGTGITSGLETNPHNVSISEMKKEAAKIVEARKAMEPVLKDIEDKLGKLDERAQEDIVKSDAEYAAAKKVAAGNAEAARKAKAHSDRINPTVQKVLDGVQSLVKDAYAAAKVGSKARAEAPIVEESFLTKSLGFWKGADSAENKFLASILDKGFANKSPTEIMKDAEKAIELIEKGFSQNVVGIKDNEVVDVTGMPKEIADKVADLKKLAYPVKRQIDEAVVRLLDNAIDAELEGALRAKQSWSSFIASQIITAKPHQKVENLREKNYSKLSDEEVKTEVNKAIALVEHGLGQPLNKKQAEDIANLRALLKKLEE